MTTKGTFNKVNENYIRNNKNVVRKQLLIFINLIVMYEKFGWHVCFHWCHRLGIEQPEIATFCTLSWLFWTNRNERITSIGNSLFWIPCFSPNQLARRAVENMLCSWGGFSWNSLRNVGGFCVGDSPPTKIEKVDVNDYY